MARKSESDLRRREFLARGGLALAGGLIGFGPEQLLAQAVAPDGGKPTGRLRIATSREVTQLGVVSGGGSESQNAYLHVYDALVTLDEKLTVVPNAATSWERISTKEWRFKLRPGIKFTNGEVLDASAVVFSIEQIAKAVPTYGYANQWGTAWPPTARAEGADTVVIATADAQPAVPRLMSRVAIIPPQAGSQPGFNNAPIGSGPYRVASWTRGRELVMEANENHWRGAPKIKTLVWTFIPDEATRTIALRGGDVDLIWDVPYERVADLRRDSRFAVLEYSSLGLGFVTFNFRKKTGPIADPRVRRAMTMAIDHQGIRDALLSGKGELSLGPAPTQALGSVDAGGFAKRDLAKAKALLTEAGYPASTKLKLIYTTGQFQHDADVCGAIIAQLGEIGVNVEFQELTAAALRDTLMTQNWDLLPNGVPGSFTGEAPYHYYQLKAQQGYESAAVEDLLNKSNNEPVEATRLDLIRRAMKVMWDDVPYLWSVGLVRNFGMVAGLKGIRYVPVNWVLLNQATV